MFAPAAPSDPAHPADYCDRKSLQLNKSLRQWQTRRKTGTQSYGPTVHHGYGRRAAEGNVRSEFAALIAVDEGFLILRLCGGEVIVDSIIVASRSSRLYAAATAPLLQARALSDEVWPVLRDPIP